MVRYLLLTCSLLLFGVLAHAQTSLGGQVVTDEGDPVIYGSVALYKNGALITGTETDFDGNYSFTGIDPGDYDVEFSYIGYSTKRVEDVFVVAEKANKLNATLGVGIDLDVIEVVGYEVPLVEADNTTQGQTLTSAEIRRRPVRSVNAIAATAAGVAAADEGGEITIRGSRSNATNYYLDGIRVSGRSIPQQDIDQLQVITGGVPAIYGDVTGGIISITSKGPSNKFGGGIEIESSQLFDNYNYNLFAANISGPIIKSKKNPDQSILGFRLSAQYLTQDDDDPPAIDIPVVTDEALAELEQNPLTEIPTSQGSTFVPSALFLEEDAFTTLDYNPNERQENLDLTTKLDLRINDAMDITFTGTYNGEDDLFTPTQTTGYLPRSNRSTLVQTDLSWQLFNTQFNPTDRRDRYRGNFRFRHRIGGSGLSSETKDEGETNKASLIQNALYTIQLGYERFNREIADPRHGDDFFSYGYFGRFNQPFDYDIIELDLDDDNIIDTAFQSDYGQRIINTAEDPYFTPAGNNPIIGRYVNPLTAPSSIINGRINNNLNSVYNFYSNVGSIYNEYFKAQDDLLTAFVNGSFELVPGKGGRHNIQFGFWYEQRRERQYILNPIELWQRADQLVNNHFVGDLDLNNQIDLIEGYVDQDGQVRDIPIYGAAFTEPEGTRLYREVREVTGQELYEYVNIHDLTPNQLRLDMFAPTELLNNNRILNYYGYDYLGNELNGVTFEDFFNEVDEDGIRTFPVAPFEPNYTAFFVQDKFKYKDIIFRLGLRVDRFDANTQVKKDNYSLYEIQGAEEFFATSNTPSSRPGNIGDDYKVYVENVGSSNVRAYRDGDTWFFPDGTQANNGNEVFGTEVIVPAYTSNEDERDITRTGFNTDLSFEDYDPQINFMPRLAFSFPISTDANFFAHYDVLVQRPPSNNIVTPIQYFYWTETGLRNNANLRPERTVDYEVGFQQKLTNSSAIKLAAYYKELRDMIQSRFFFQNADPGLVEYETYDNLDFGTVKGFTLQYDLRRTQNVSLNVAYTLQFADGTGSDANSSRNTGSRTVQRVLFPLNFDERHRLNVNLDYRYGAGKQYNGPTIGGVDIFANTGVNLQFTAVSGRPYTRNANILNPFQGVETVGSINGSRLPWTQLLNLRVDRTFTLSKPGASRPLLMNLSFRVSNLLDARNIINVYSVTGSPVDDGFLASVRGQQIVNGLPENQVQPFLTSYQFRVANNDNFSLPRRMFLGLTFDF